MSNLHTGPVDVSAEWQAITADLLASVLLATTLDVPASSMTLAPFSARGYVRTGTPPRLTYVEQSAVSLTIAGGDGTYWIALCADLATPLSGWTRRDGSHYAWRASGTQPADPPGALVMASVTVAGGIITAVSSAVNHPASKLAFGDTGGHLAFDTRLTWNASSAALTVQGAAAIASLALTTPLPLTSGGTGAQDAVQARTNLGLGNMVTLNSPLPLANGGTQATTAAQARTNLGLGTMATLNSPLPLANGGTQATDAAGARSNLGLGSMATQNANGVSISGGSATLSNAAITLLSVNGGVQGGYQLSVTGSTWISSTLQVQGAINTASGATISGALGVGAANPGGYTVYVQGNQRIITDLLIGGTAYKPGGGMWADSSSRAMKTNIQPIAHALALLLAQRGCTYTWTEPAHAAARPGLQYGLIAEDVTIPQWCAVGPDGATPGLCPVGFEALTIEALRELQARLAALEQQAQDAEHPSCTQEQPVGDARHIPGERERLHGGAV